MIGDQAHDLVPDVEPVDGVDVEPIEPRQRRRDSCRLVARRPDAAVRERRGERLAEVVADRTEQHREAVRPVEVVHDGPGLVDYQQGVRPDVTLGMPLRFLRAVHERRHLGDERLDDAQFQAQFEADGGAPGEEQQFLEFAEHAFRWQVVEADAPAHPFRFLVHPQREASGELQAPEHTEAVVRKRRGVHHSQDARVEVAPAAERVVPLARQGIDEHRVDGEIAAAAGLVDGHERVALDLEPSMAAADLRFAARQRHVDARHLVDGEGLADGVDATDLLEQFAESTRGKPVDLQVDVARLESQQPIPCPASGDEHPPAGGAHPMRDGQYWLGKRVTGSVHPPLFLAPAFARRPVGRLRRGKPCPSALVPRPCLTSA